MKTGKQSDKERQNKKNRSLKFWNEFKKFTKHKSYKYLCEIWQYAVMISN